MRIKTISAKLTALLLSVTFICSPCTVFATETDTKGTPNYESGGLSQDASTEDIKAYMDSLSSNSSLSLGDMKQAAKATDIRAMLNAEDYTSVYGDVLDSISGNDMMKLSMAIGSQMNISVPESIAADVAVMDYSSVYDTGLLNLQYMALSQSYTDNYIKAESANKAGDCMELFKNTYGDLASSLKLETPEIPSDFQPDKMVSQMSAQMEATYKDSTSKGQFASIKNSISIGNIFDMAQAGYSGKYDMSMPGISFGDLPSTPLAGAYDSIAAQASAKNSTVANMKSMGMNMANAAKGNRDSNYASIQGQFNAKNSGGSNSKGQNNNTTGTTTQTPGLYVAPNGRRTN